MSKGDEALQLKTFLSQGSRLPHVPRVHIGMWLGSMTIFKGHISLISLPVLFFLQRLCIRFFCRSEGNKWLS